MFTKLDIKENMKRNIKLAVIFLIIVLIILLSIELYSIMSIVKIETVKMNFSVSSKPHVVGMNPTGELLHFGTVPRGGRGNRNITLEHVYSYPLKVQFKTTGNISSFVAVSDNGFILRPDESRDIRVSVHPPMDAKASRYVGELSIIFRKPLIT